MKIKHQIPHEWKEVTLQKLADKIGDGLHATPKYSDSGKYYFINGNNINNGNILITKNTKSVDEEEYYKYKNDLNYSTLLLSINGTIGSVAYYKGENVILGKSAAYINCSELVIKKFVFYLLNTSRTKNYFESELTGSTIKNLSLKSIRGLKLNYPPLPEQEAIVEVLETWDMYLEQLDRKIAVKKNIKKGLMQQLLTGKKRLPGFSGEWNDTKLGQCLKIKHGKSQKQVEKENGKYPILGTSGEIGRTDAYLYNCESVLIGRKGTIDKPQYMNTPFWTVDTLFYSEMKHNNLAKYFYYYFSIINWKKYNEGSGVPSLSASTISSIKIKTPSSIKEQSAIAEVLTAADAEIGLLVRKRELVAEQKRFLLNNLITGKMRLPEFVD